MTWGTPTPDLNTLVNKYKDVVKVNSKQLPHFSCFGYLLSQDTLHKLVSYKMTLLILLNQPCAQLRLLPWRPSGNKRLQLWDANCLIKDPLLWLKWRAGCLICLWPWEAVALVVKSGQNIYNCCIHILVFTLAWHSLHLFNFTSVSVLKENWFTARPQTVARRHDKHSTITRQHTTIRISWLPSLVNVDYVTAIMSFLCFLPHPFTLHTDISTWWRDNI